MSRWQHFWLKIRNYEYWPFAIFYFPVFFYYIILALKRGAFFFFSASNPSIENGGMLGESKWSIFKKIPESLIPKTQLFEANVKSVDVYKYMQESDIDFPIICKPDIGERGWMVEKIDTLEKLEYYLNEIKVPFLVQEYVSFPLELGVFYVKIPDEEKGRVTSIVRKGFLSVMGNGNDTVIRLLEEKARANLAFNYESHYSKELLSLIPENNEVVVVEPIGNHSRGTSFLNDNHRITPELNDRFEAIATSIGDFYFGRFDIKTTSYDDLKKGESFKILELNGAGSEPGHIYDPAFSIGRAYRDIFKHLNLLAKVSYVNHRKGVPYLSLREGWSEFRKIRKYNKEKK